MLIDQGADVDQRDENGGSPLHSAGQWGACYTTRVLIEAGALLHARDNEMNTPLHLAAGHGSQCTIKVRNVEHYVVD